MTAEPLSVPVEPITAHAFAAYGDLLEQPRPGARQDFAARVENHRPGARANVALVRCQPFSGTPIRVLERHRFSTQFFAPLGLAAYLVVVANDFLNEPRVATVKAFRVSGYQAINYHAGTWHAAMATLGTAGCFAMLVHEDGSPADCDILELRQAILIEGLQAR